MQRGRPSAPTAPVFDDGGGRGPAVPDASSVATERIPLTRCVVRQALGHRTHRPFPQLLRIRNALIGPGATLLEDWSLRIRRGDPLSWWDVSQGALRLLPLA